MTTQAVSSYPQLVKMGSPLAALGEITKVGDFELIHPSVPATNMESAGWKEKIGSGLKEVGDINLTLNYFLGALDDLMTLWSAGTPEDFSITYKNTEVGTFSALVTHIKVLGADADKPDAPQQAEITLEVTGSATLAVPTP